MSWVRLDDQYPDHPKVRALGPLGLALQTAAICYCGRYLTDGFLSFTSAAGIIASIMAPFTLQNGSVWTPGITSGASGKDAQEIDWAVEMVKAGLWEPRKRGYYVHDYLDFNPSRAEVLRARALAAARVDAYRARNAERNDGGNATGNAVSASLVQVSPSPSYRRRKKETTGAKPMPDGLSPSRLEPEDGLAAVHAQEAEASRRRFEALVQETSSRLGFTP